MYSERLIEHFRNPRHVGELPSPAVVAEVTNPVCGDILRLSALFEGDCVTEARYRTRGCTASIAAGSALAEWMSGKTRTELAALCAADIEQAVGGLSPESRHAASLCIDAVRALLAHPR
jgi:nitrogen fixation protein NifU and related proteins